MNQSYLLLIGYFKGKVRKKPVYIVASGESKLAKGADDWYFVDIFAFDFYFGQLFVNIAN